MAYHCLGQAAEARQWLGHPLDHAVEKVRCRREREQCRERDHAVLRARRGDRADDGRFLDAVGVEGAMLELLVDEVDRAAQRQRARNRRVARQRAGDGVERSGELVGVARRFLGHQLVGVLPRHVERGQGRPGDTPAVDRVADALHEAAK